MNQFLLRKHSVGQMLKHSVTAAIKPIQYLSTATRLLRLLLAEKLQAQVKPIFT